MQIALLMPDVYEAALKDAELQRQGAASSANPYGSFLPNPHYYRGGAGYGTPCLTCGEGPAAHDMNAAHEPAPDHLAQHVGADPVCVICLVDHDAARRGVTTIVHPAADLAGHMPEGAQ